MVENFFHKMRFKIDEVLLSFHSSYFSLESALIFLNYSWNLFLGAYT